MAQDVYRIAIIGSGPGGLSAACRAADTGTSHILLEAQSQLSNTVFRFQKGKHVMAEPSWLPLRSAARFDPGSRENVLKLWHEDALRPGLNIRYQAEVSGVRKDGELFQLTLKSGEVIQAENVVLCVGVQGNPNRMKVPGEDRLEVQYQLDDPQAFHGETIVVVGAGDAAIENALALAAQNTVHLINRGPEFARAKEGNISLVLQAIEQGRIHCHYSCSPEAIEELPPEHASGCPLLLRLSTREGTTPLPLHRIIARLGAAPQRAFVEACGVVFPNSDLASVPQVSATYESNVSGLYIIGALAGYPLIKQAMNQGYEVVEFICGREVEPADAPVLKQRFAVFAASPDVEMLLDVIPARSQLLGSMNRLQLREFLIESLMRRVPAGTTIYERGSFADSVFVVIAGEVLLTMSTDSGEVRLKPVKTGRVFGEVALMSGRPRSVTAVAGEGCVLVEVPRRAVLKLIASSPTVQRYFNRIFCSRALERFLLPGIDEGKLRPIVESTTLRVFKAGEIVYAAGDKAATINLIRSGSVMIYDSVGGREVVQKSLAAGDYFGELDVIAGTSRTQYARATIKSEIIGIDAATFVDLLNEDPQLKDTVRKRFSLQLQQRQEMARNPERGERMAFLLREGIGEATDALIIDESLCIRCDQCEKACAATHGEVSRLNREAGPTFDNLHVPISCRHCEHPHCMKDCPPNAIRRQPNGEVVIHSTCIGCGNCERNCPYGVIKMGIATPADENPRRSLWQWMIQGKGAAPGERHPEYPKDAVKKALKCDRCVDRKEQGPACVQACPTGAAIRVNPQQFFDALARGAR